jgi:hypothetical protein
MKKIVRLTESDLARIVRRVITEAEAGAMAASPKKITKDFTVTGDDALHLKISPKVGGMANKLAGNPNVVEFDALLKYSKVPTADGSFDQKNAGRVIPIKGYFGCTSGKLTAKDPSTGQTVQFFDNSMNVSMMAFEDFLSQSGLCPNL